MHFAAIILVILLSAVACKEKPSNPVQKYGDVMLDSYKKGQEAGDLANLAVLRNAVSAYHASEGRYPVTLGELRNLLASDMDLSRFSYDPRTGTVSPKTD